MRRTYDGAGIWSHPDIGVYDSSWAEYNPTCTSVEFDGETYLFTLAEPKNAISSLRGFDVLTCVDRADFAHEPAAALGWGSFAFHGTGNPDSGWAWKSDTHGMQCLLLRLLYQVRPRTCFIR